MDVLNLFIVIAVVAIVIFSVIGYFAVGAMRGQAKILEKQAILLRGNIYPLLEIERFQVNENKFTIMLTDYGNGPAFQIGLLTHFVPLQPQKIGYDFQSVLLDPSTNTKAYPSEMVSYLKNSRGISRLHPSDQMDEFKGEVFFGLAPYSKGAEYPWLDLIQGKTVYTGRVCSFDDLAKLLLSNGVHFVALHTSLVYMDITETIIETRQICDVVADIDKHKNYEEVIKDRVTFRQTAIGLDEMIYLPFNDYKNRKSRRFFLEDHP